MRCSGELERCPVCHGTGRLLKAGEAPEMVATPHGIVVTNARRCDACDGTGYLGKSRGMAG